MLSRPYKENLRLEPLPFSEVYFVSYMGDIPQLTHYKDGAIPTINGCVNLIVEDPQKGALELTVDLAVLVWLTSRDTHQLYPQYWVDMEFLYLDGNSANKSPTNIILACPKPSTMEDLQFKGFTVIPGYSRYAINRNGCIVSRKTKKQLPGTRPTDYYHRASVVGDDGFPSGLGIHRLLALAFKPYPANVDTLDVAHDDEISTSNHLDNINWRTRAENMAANARSGKHLQTKILLAYDHENELFLEWPSLGEAARQLGIDKRHLSHYIDRIDKVTNKTTITSKNLSFTYDGECESIYLYPDWRNYRRAALTQNAQQKTNTDEYITVQGDNVTTHPNRNALQLHLKLTQDVLKRLMDTHPNDREHNGVKLYSAMEYKLISSGEYLPNIYQCKVKFFDEGGIIRDYASVAHAAHKLKVSPGVIKKKLLEDDRTKTDSWQLLRADVDDSFFDDACTNHRKEEKRGGGKALTFHVTDLTNGETQTVEGALALDRLLGEAPGKVHQVLKTSATNRALVFSNFNGFKITLL